jgi:molybdate transport system permease protein
MNTPQYLKLDVGKVVFWACATILILFIVIPIISIFLTISGGNALAEITDIVTLNSIKLSLLTSTASMLLIVFFGTPTARLLARSKIRGKRIIDSIIDIPIVLPPSVAGIALLLAFAPRSPIGIFLKHYGIILPGSIWAVVLAQSFVALPYYVRSARTAFEEIDPKLETAAAVLSPSRLFSFSRVVLPLASRGLISGAILAWGRALGEFGATLMFAGNLPGITQTMPLAIYLGLSVDLYRASFISAILIIISFGIIIGVRHFEPKGRR